MSETKALEDLIANTRIWAEDTGLKNALKIAGQAAAELEELVNHVKYLENEAFGCFGTNAQLRIELDRARGMIGDLQISESDYRSSHDVFGYGSPEAGRTWENMRNAGDRARVYLRSLQKDGEK